MEREARLIVRRDTSVASVRKLSTRQSLRSLARCVLATQAIEKQRILANPRESSEIL